MAQLLTYSLIHSISPTHTPGGFINCKTNSEIKSAHSRNIPGDLLIVLVKLYQLAHIH